MPEKGLQDAKGKHGDFFVVVQIVAPESLSEQGRGMLETLAEELKNPSDASVWADDVGDDSG